MSTSVESFARPIRMGLPVKAIRVPANAPSVTINWDSAPRVAMAGKPKRSRRPVAENRPARGALSQLMVTEGALAGTRIALTGKPILIGRANDSTLVLTDDYASTRHARISETNGVWYLEDLGSTNGTYVGQSKVNGPIPLEAGVVIRIGKTAMELR